MERRNKAITHAHIQTKHKQRKTNAKQQKQPKHQKPNKTPPNNKTKEEGSAGFTGVAFCIHLSRVN